MDVLLFFFVFDTKHVLRFAIDGGATTRRRRERRIANDDDGMERDTQILSDLPLGLSGCDVDDDDDVSSFQTKIATRKIAAENVKRHQRDPIHSSNAASKR